MNVAFQEITKKSKLTSFNKHLFLNLLLLFSLTVGFRPIFVGTDTAGYFYYYQVLYQNKPFSPEFEYLYQNIALLLAYFFNSPHALFSCLAMINFMVISFLVLKLVKLSEDQLNLNRFVCFIILFLTVSPFFFAATVNVIRQGCAIFALFVFYVSLVSSRINWFVLIGSWLIAYGFHHSALIALIFSPLLLLNERWIFNVILAASCCYLLGFSEKFIHILSYLSQHDIYTKINNYASHLVYKRGIRFDFVIFTLGMGTLAKLAGYFLLQEKDKRVYFLLLKVYWILVLPFFLFGFASFSDRFLLPGWLFLSVIAAYLFSVLYRNFALGPLILISLAGSSYFLLKVQGII